MDSPNFLRGGGAMGELTRAFDWSNTTPGPVDNWPQSLRTTVATVLRSRLPMMLWWGSEFISFYNDAFRVILRDDPTRSEVLGKAALEVWPELWAVIGPQLESNLAGEEFPSREILVAMFKNDPQERAQWILNYSPVIDDHDSVGGILFAAASTNGKAEPEIDPGRSSYHELHDLFEDAPFAMAIIAADDGLHFLTANRLYIELVGRDASEFIGKPLLEALPELRGQGFDLILKGVVRTRVPYKAYEVPVKLARNNSLETVYLNFSYVPRSNDSGKVTGILVTAIDVTFQVHARQAIEAKEAQFRALVEAAPFPIGVYIGEEMEILYANPAIMNVYAKGPDVIGKKYLELLPELVGQGVADQVREVYKTGKPFDSGTRRIAIVANGGDIAYYFKYSFVPLFDQYGKVYGVLNTGVDITELELSRQRAHEAEANLISAIELAELAPWRIDIIGRVMHVSERLRVWTGIGQDAVDLATFLEYIPPGFRAAVSDAYEQAFQADHGAGFDIEYPLIRRQTGDHRFVHVRGQVIRNSTHGQASLTGTIQDITKQRELQWELERQVAERTAELAELNKALQSANLELERKNTELKYSNDELSQYAYVTSHDLQEPLRKIRFFITMIRERFPLVPAADEVMQKINRSSARMTQLIQDLLSFSRLLGTDEVMRPVDLRQIISTVLEDFELTIQEKQAEVRVGSLPVASGMAAQLNQLFHNLIGNALKFAAPGRLPVIEIFARAVSWDDVAGLARRPIDSDYYDIVVTDNGIGFEQQFAGYIFEPFKQLHPRDVYPGSGIGLTLCRRIAANHRGYLYAKSKPGEGSSFHLILPAKVAIMVDDKTVISF